MWAEEEEARILDRSLPDDELPSSLLPLGGGQSQWSSNRRTSLLGVYRIAADAGVVASGVAD